MTTEELRTTLTDIGDLLRKVEANVPLELLDALMPLLTRDSMLSLTQSAGQGKIVEVLKSFRQALADGSLGKAGDICSNLANRKLILPLVAHLL